MKHFFVPRSRCVSFSAHVLSVLLLCLYGTFFLTHGVFAVNSAETLDAFGAAAGVSQESLPILIARIIRTGLGLIGIAFTVIIIYAGLLYVNSRGDSTKTAKAKKLIQNAIIGIVLILSSYSIASWILGKLLDAANGPGSIVSIAKKYVEPLAGSLGAGMIESHFPSRNATGVARNTKMFVTFKEPINPATIIDGFVSPCSYTGAEGVPACATNVKTNAVSIFETAEGEDEKLVANQVVVTVSEDRKTFVFDPVAYLGDGQKEVNYSVALKPTIKKANGSAVFTGVNAAGYGWNFTVSTTIDLTPPKVVSVIPSISPLLPPGETIDERLARNIAVEITFNEPMDPVATSGTYELNGGDSKSFTNIMVQKWVDEGLVTIDGSFVVSNGYRTIGFVSTDACGEDPCGGTIYCLPGGADIRVTAKAASIDEANAPQAILVNGFSYDGVVDAAGNSLNGNGDAKACGSDDDDIACEPVTQSNDNYLWNFTTTSLVDTTIPKIKSLAPGILEGNIDPAADITLTFNTLLMASTINSNNVFLAPHPTYSSWFVSTKVDAPAESPTETTIRLSHAPFVANAEGGAEYWPVVTSDVRSAYQICMLPPMQVGAEAGACSGSDPYKPFCCNGAPSENACPFPTN